MILAKTFECIVAPIADKAGTAMRCSGEIVTAVSPWDIFTTFANWGILIVAAAALAVSEISRRNSRAAMRDAQEASEAAVKAQIGSAEETLDANYKAVQAQLDAMRAATQADLEERRNSRELEMTAGLVTALDELKLVASREATEKDRGTALRQAVMAVYAAAGRYQLFVGDSQEIAGLQEQYIRLLQDFAPTSMEDFEGLQHERIHRILGVLRTGIIVYQKSKGVPDMTRHLRGNLKLGKLEIVDQILGIGPDERHFPNTVG